MTLRSVVPGAFALAGTAAGFDVAIPSSRRKG